MPDFIDELQRRLVELGCPTRQRRRLVQEVADHREDLKQAALAEGSGETEAQARAHSQLGNPEALAEHLIEVLRRSSWWGRHPVFGFCVLPLLMFPVLWALIIILVIILEFLVGYNLHVAKQNPTAFPHLALVFHGGDYVAIALATLFFCWLARRSAVNLTWMSIACGICSLCALFTRISIDPHAIVLGLSSTLQWMRAAIPLLVAGVVYAVEWRFRKAYALVKQPA
jgi:hypothetical protein